jgi:hypothetical protein
MIGTRLKIINSLSEICWRGLVEEVRIKGLRNEKVELILRQPHSQLLNEETAKNYEGTSGKITAVDTTTITDDQQAWTVDEFAGKGVGLSPGSDPGSEIQSITTATPSGGGGTFYPVSNVNTDDGTSLNWAVSAGSETLTLTGTLSAIAKGDINNIAISLTAQMRQLLLTSQTLTLKIYNYTTPGYETIETRTRAPGLWPVAFFPVDILQGTVDGNDYVETGTDEFKIQLSHSIAGDVKIFYLLVEMYTDELYAGAFYPVTSNTATVLTVTGSPSTTGVDVGDFIKVGTVNTTVLQQLLEEHAFYILNDIDTGMTGYTAADFAGQNFTTDQAVRQVLKKEEGILVFKDQDNTLYLVKKDNLDDLSSTYDFGNTQAVEWLEIQNRRSAVHRAVEVTGASYKILEDEVSVYARVEQSGVKSTKTKRISDDTIGTVTEARKFAAGELAILNNEDPSFTFRYDKSPGFFYVGAEVNVTFDGTTYKLPIKSITVSWKGKGSLRQVFEVGFQGTPPADRQRNDINELKAGQNRNNRAINIRSVGVVSGSISSHSHTHASTTGQTTDDHHAQAHAAEHYPGAADELLLDEDDMSTDSATKGTSQQAAKAYADNKQPKHGFEDLDDSTLSFDDGTRTLTLTKVNDFAYWLGGVKYTKTATDSVQIDDTEGIWYIYYSGSTLTASQTPWSITDLTKTPVSILYWDATNSLGTPPGDERHTTSMSKGTHNNLHHTRGATFEEGFGLTEGTAGDAGKIALEGGEIHDEDIEILVVDGAGSGRFEQELGLASPFAAAQIPVFYRSGASAWRWYTAGNYPFYDNSGADNVHYNAEAAGSWSSTAAASAAKYLAMWIFCTNYWNEPVIAIMGQNESNTLAQAKVADTLGSLQLGTLLTPEMKILYRIIYKSDGTISEVTDFRRNNSGPAGDFVATSHDSLTGITSDNHHDQLHATSHHPSGTDELLLDEDNMTTDSATKGSSQQAIKAYVDKHGMIGSANAQWVPCLHASYTEYSYVNSGGALPKNAGTDDFFASFVLPLPTSKGGLSLYIDDFKMQLFDADSNNYIDFVRVDGLTKTDDGVGTATFYLDETALMDSVDTFTSDGTGDLADWGAADDASGYRYVTVLLHTTLDTASALDWNTPLLHCYYA